MKKRLRELLETQQFDEIAELASSRKRTLGFLVSLTFDASPLVAWRAVEAIGVAADRVARENPEYVRNHLRRLHWLLSEESGGVCWYAPQAMAEIVRRRPRMFADYAGIVVSLIRTVEPEDLAHFLPGILWAIGRLAPVAGEAVQTVLPVVAECLDEADPQVRGMAVWCLKQTGRQDLFAEHADLLRDEGPVDLYENGRLEHTSVRAIVRT